MDPHGFVRAVNGATVTVELVRAEACGSCGAAAVCFPGGGSRHRVNAENRADAAVGDRVRIVLRHGTVLGAVSLSYGLLLAGLMAGLVTGYAVGPASDLSTALGGLLGLAAGGAMMALVGRRLRAHGRFRSLALPADPSP